MFSVKTFTLSTFQRLMTMLLLALIVPAISAIHSHCFLVNKGYPQSQTLQDDSRGTGMVNHEPLCVRCTRQKWWLFGDDHTFSIINFATRRMLACHPNGRVYSSSQNGGPGQKWRWNGDCLQNIATGLYLAIANDVFTTSYTGAANQQWERRDETKFDLKILG